MYIHTFQRVNAVRFKTLLAIAVMVTALPLSSSLFAQGNTSTQGATVPSTAQAHLNFDQVLHKVQSYQASLGVWQVQQDIANANIKQSGLWENPTLTIQQTGFSSSQDQELDFEISQKLDVFGERRAAKQIAEAQRKQVDLNQNLYDAQLTLVVKYLWSHIAVLELENQVAQQQLANSRAILEASQRRYQAGSIAQVDQERTLMSHIENQRAAQEVELNLDIAKKRLANLWGETQAPFVFGLNNQSAWPIRTKANVAQYLQQNLLQRSIALQLELERSNVNYLKAKRRPNPTLSMGVTNTKTADTRQNDQQFRVGLSIPFNIFDRQQYPLQIAQTQQDFLVKQKQFYLQQNLNSIDTLQTELVGLKQQYDLMNDQQIPLSEQVQGKMLLGFKAGKYAITDVQQATTQLQEQRLKKVQLLKSAWQKAIETESLALGIEPEQLMGSNALNQINQSLWQATRNANSFLGAQ